MKQILVLLLIVLLTLSLLSCDNKLTHLQRVQQAGELRVLILNIPGVYYEGPFGPVGFEYELLQEFADFLQVKLKLVTQRNVPSLLSALQQGKADLAASRIIVTDERKKNFRFSDAYHHLDQYLVYKKSSRVPRRIMDLQLIEFDVVSHSSQEDILQKLKRNIIPQLKWRSHPQSSVQELLYQLNENRIQYTIANSQELSINQAFYPEIRKGMSLVQNQPVAFAFTADVDDSLLQKANEFIRQYQKSYRFSILHERYYGHIDHFDYVDVRTFQRHIKKRLPKYQPWFEKAGADQNLDWQLLAAMSYQESHWNDKARSPTGVKGLMMLTQATARYLGLNNRTSPVQSIFGGAEYFKKLYNRLPEKVKEPDRIYFALAAYNIGYGHLIDAMKLCKKRGLDETKWAHLKQALPLLQRRKWYKQTRYGFARGNEAVRYVTNIRKYYDILKWQTEGAKKTFIQLQKQEASLPQTGSEDKKGSAVDMILPAL